MYQFEISIPFDCFVVKAQLLSNSIDFIAFALVGHAPWDQDQYSLSCVSFMTSLDTADLDSR